MRLAEPTEHGGEQRLGQVRNTSHSGQALNQFILEDSSTFICIPVSSNLCCHFLYLLRNLEPLGCYLVPDAQSHPPIVATLSSERDSSPGISRQSFLKASRLMIIKHQRHTKTASTAIEPSSQSMNNSLIKVELDGVAVKTASVAKFSGTMVQHILGHLYMPSIR